MRNKLQRFMMGRYGIDKMNQVLSVCSLILVALGIFLKVSVLYWAGLVLIGFIYFRMLSKDIPKRYAENQAFFTALLSSDRMVRQQEAVDGTE